jgi:heme/copper-type cytochrome/quinol oxidase subunit 2
MKTSDDTAAASPADEPETTVSKTAHVDRSELAWSLDDDSDEPQRQPWRSVWGIVAVIAACSVVVAGVIGLVVWLVSRSGHDVPPPKPSAAPTVSSSVAAPAPTSTVPPVTTVTVTAPPTTTTSLTPQERDAQFVALVAPKLPSWANDRLPLVGQDICKGIGEGKSQAELVDIEQRLGDLTWDAANFLVTTAVQTYCPQYANR